MRTAHVAHCGPTKHSQMEALLAESRHFQLRLSEVNSLKPWGGYLRFSQDSLVPFLAAYWLDIDFKPPLVESDVDPKILLVAPQQMLSLQWHERRGEIWRVIDGPVQVTIGDDWDTLSHNVYESGSLIEIPPRKWHRLIGRKAWGRVAEIWDHTDVTMPSDESDIIREHDIYGRADSQADAKWNSVYPHSSIASSARERTDGCVPLMRVNDHGSDSCL
ncbi:MAG: mannose-6-phosphate isomerase [Porticoccaceae bacterium]|jgi:mannose-6-phosphate isomerase